jgi:DNA-binding NtrC family response regulator
MNIIGKSPAMQAIYEVLTKAMTTDANVIIYGETGTGKDLIAHTLHQLSDRRKHAFVAVNCGAIPENLFEREFFGHRS